MKYCKRKIDTLQDLLDELYKIQHWRYGQVLIPEIILIDNAGTVWDILNLKYDSSEDWLSKSIYLKNNKVYFGNEVEACYTIYVDPKENENEYQEFKW